MAEPLGLGMGTLDAMAERSPVKVVIAEPPEPEPEPEPEPFALPQKSLAESLSPSRFSACTERTSLMISERPSARAAAAAAAEAGAGPAADAKGAAPKGAAPQGAAPREKVPWDATTLFTSGVSLINLKRRTDRLEAFLEDARPKALGDGVAVDVVEAFDGFQLHRGGSFLNGMFEPLDASNLAEREPSVEPGCRFGVRRYAEGTGNCCFRPERTLGMHCYALRNTAARSSRTTCPSPAPSTRGLADNGWFGLDVFCLVVPGEGVGGAGGKLAAGPEAVADAVAVAGPVAAAVVAPADGDAARRGGGDAAAVVGDADVGGGAKARAHGGRPRVAESDGEPPRREDEPGRGAAGQARAGEAAPSLLHAVAPVRKPKVSGRRMEDYVHRAELEAAARRARGRRRRAVDGAVEPPGLAAGLARRRAGDEAAAARQGVRAKAPEEPAHRDFGHAAIPNLHRGTFSEADHLGRAGMGTLTRGLRRMIETTPVASGSNRPVAVGRAPGSRADAQQPQAVAGREPRDDARPRRAAARLAAQLEPDEGPGQREREAARGAGVAPARRAAARRRRPAARRAAARRRRPGPRRRAAAPSARPGRRAGPRARPAGRPGTSPAGTVRTPPGAYGSARTPPGSGGRMGQRSSTPKTVSNNVGKFAVGATIRVASGGQSRPVGATTRVGQGRPVGATTRVGPGQSRPVGATTRVGPGQSGPGQGRATDKWGRVGRSRQGNLATIRS
ncbi:hypothetical protein SO694_00211025 [Aureococcus anophagefferens]|uniref:Uncharacterized protein n=1 Tax=Aureococcus anophagefferens TaxID=44056 RepID=A0ABR1FG42_AURAN